VEDAEQQIDRARRSLRHREVRAAYLFLAPNLVLFAVFLLFPVLWVARQSFMEGGVLGPPEWVGLDNWEQVFQSSETLASLGTTLRFTALFVPAVVVLAVGLALLLRRIRRGAGLLRAIVYVPAIAPIVIAATIWIFMVHPDFGVLTVGPRLVGAAAPNWLGDGSYALVTIVMLELWRSVGFWGMLILAAMLAVPRDLYDAARIDGARAARRFLHITLPGVRLTLLVVLLLTVVAALQVFDSVFVLTNGGPGGATNTVGLYIYKSIFESGEPGYGAALSLMLVAVVMAITAFMALIPRRRVGARA
jgi:multiple sugar transport system permease protein